MKMKLETLANLLQLIVFATLGLAALIVALFYSAWWHFFTAAACFGFSWLLFTDDAYGIESVKAYFIRKYSK